MRNSVTAADGRTMKAKSIATSEKRMLRAACKTTVRNEVCTYKYNKYCIYINLLICSPQDQNTEVEKRSTCSVSVKKKKKKVFSSLKQTQT